jgi:molybdate transport system substrate-binding protein
MRSMKRCAALAILMGMFSTPLAAAADLQVFGGGPMQAAGPLLVEGFVESSGTPAAYVRGSARRIRESLDGGTQLDVVIMSPDDIAALEVEGIVKAGSAHIVAYNGLGVGMRSGAVRADLSTPEKFRDALLAARALSLPDPEAGTSTSIYVQKILNDLGIADQIADKTVWLRGPTARGIVSGDADLSIGSIPEIVVVEGAELAGPLPGDLQDNRPLAVGIIAQTENGAAAEEFVRYLSSAGAVSLWKAGGADPVEK